MIWYVAAGSDGFTSDPAQAVKDRQGNPLICPGDMNRVWKKHYSKDKEKREKLWTMLLDAMEESYSADSVGQDAILIANTRVKALEESVALFTFGEITENNLMIVKREAEMRYDNE